MFGREFRRGAEIGTRGRQWCSARKTLKEFFLFRPARNKWGEIWSNGKTQPMIDRVWALNPTLVGTSRCDVSARAAAGGTNNPPRTHQLRVAPLNAALTAQRAVPTQCRPLRRKLCWGILTAAAPFFGKGKIHGSMPQAKSLPNTTGEGACAPRNNERHQRAPNGTKAHRKINFHGFLPFHFHVCLPFFTDFRFLRRSTALTERPSRIPLGRLPVPPKRTPG